MKIFFDENFSHFLAKGISHFQKGRKEEGIEVFHITELLERGVADDVWIPKVAQIHGVVITQDLNINRTKYLNEICKKNKIGIFYFKPPSKNAYSYWDWVFQVIKRWDEIKQNAQNTTKPFAYLIKARSSKIIKL